MVSPILLIAVPLFVAFLTAPLHRISKRLSLGVTLLTLLFTAAVSIQWLVALLGGTAAGQSLTAGFLPPLSIRLEMGVVEAGLSLLVSLAFLFTTVLMQRRFRTEGSGASVLWLLMAMGAIGIVLTRDLFNLFVFLEIMAIATYAMIALERNERTLSAGFKYVIAGGIASALLLLGTVFLYRLTGTLDIDGMIQALRGGAGAPLGAAGGSVAALSAAGMAALFLVLAAILIELKPFPANGWALDVYEAAHPGVAAVISIASSSAVLAALYKIVPLLPQAMITGVIGLGFLTFFASNLIGMKQQQLRRLLGYSSVAQIGLIAAALGSAALLELSTGATLVVVGGLLVNHFFAKGGLFWSASILDVQKVTDIRGVLRRRGRAAFVVAALVVALAGLPPFPGFWAKWQFVGALVGSGSYIWLAFLLFGSLFEAAYLFRFFAEGMRAPAAAAEEERGPRRLDGIAGSARVREGAAAGGSLSLPALFALANVAAGLGTAWLLGFRELVPLLPLAAAAALALLEWLPAKLKALLSLAAVSGYALFIYPLLSGIALLFFAVIAGGSALVLIAATARSGRAAGYFPLTLLLALSMASLLAAATPLAFFLGYELMTLSSYFLLLRRREAWRAAHRYLLFSIGGALLLLPGLWFLSYAGIGFAPAALAAAGAGTTAASGIAGFGGIPLSLALNAGVILVALAFLVKAGAVGVHLWLPGGYAEAEGESSALFSGVISKVPLFGLVVLGTALAGVLGQVAADMAGGGASVLSLLPGAIGWIGILTALFGALLAVFQEDVKYLLAYSSMSQIGYIVLAIGLMTHLGWSTALYGTLLHFIFKVMLFLAIAGVVLRAGTSKVYELGGLIARMPVSFISVLMAIIAVSGVPPLAGFGGKWLLYTALFENGWYWQAAVAFFASTIAFLYLFKLIYTVFLGQLKDSLRAVREAPLWLLIPQLLLIAALMGMSMFPTVVLEPIAAAVAPYFPQSIQLDDYTVVSVLGYWNGNAVMWVTMGVFALPLIWLLAVMRRPQRVGQLNIVYAAERPERPETTHFAHNFFAHYSRALGFLVRPGVIRFWEGVAGGVGAGGAALRRLYSGNGQTYALHILITLGVLYLIMGGLQ